MTAEKLSRLISGLMHPLVMPLYAVLLFLYGDSILNLIPSQVKLNLLLTVFVTTFVIPLFCIILLRRVGYLKSLSLEARRDRALPLLITALSYGVCIFLILDLTMAFLIVTLLMAGAACVVFALTVTCFWKISLHMIGTGSVAAMMLMVDVGGLGNMLLPLTITLLLCGALASARLCLGAHTPAQVAAGFFGGALITFFIVL